WNVRVYLPGFIAPALEHLRQQAVTAPEVEDDRAFGHHTSLVERDERAVRREVPSKTALVGIVRQRPALLGVGLVEPGRRNHLEAQASTTLAVLGQVPAAQYLEGPLVVEAVAADPA